MQDGGVTTHKPLLEIGGIPSTRYVAERLLRGGFDFSQLLLVIPPEREAEYQEAMKGIDCVLVVQPVALGTANAVLHALDYLLSPIDQIYLSFGTQPMITNATVSTTLQHHLENHLAFTLATTIMDNPYAPLLRDDEGKVSGSVETHLEKTEVPTHGETNIGAYWVSRELLEVGLRELHEKMFDGGTRRYRTPSGELGFPNEMVRLCVSEGLGVDGVPCAEPVEILGLKTPETLAEIRSLIEELTE